MKKLQFVLTTILLFSFLVSCTDTVVPVLTGSISGFVDLYEEDGSQINDKSGVKISIEGRNNFAFTNSDGRYHLENVSAGIFNIVYEKEGFGLNKIIAREFVGGGNAFINSIPLLKLPNFNVTSLNIIKAQGSSDLTISGNISNAKSYSRYVISFFGKSENVSNDPQNYLMATHIYVYRDSTTFTSSWSNLNESLLAVGFNSGETIYVAAYSSSLTYSYTPDPITGRLFYYNVGSSPAKANFILD